MRLWELELNIRKRLLKAGVESPGLCSRLLLEQLTGLDHSAFLANLDYEFPDSRFPQLYDMISRCEKGEPLAYIIGKRDFYAHTFLISPDVLIPRPETELLVEQALQLLPSTPITFADLGAGSGCIGLSLLAERPGWQAMLIDKSSKALEICRRNAGMLKLSPVLLLADMFHLPFIQGSLSLIISNPPYISPSEISDVMPEVLAYEPHNALFSRHGTAHLKVLIRQGATLLRPGGFIILEHGHTQQDEICEFLTRTGFINIKTFRDLGGLPRCVVAQKF